MKKGQKIKKGIPKEEAYKIVSCTRNRFVQGLRNELRNRREH